MRLKKVQSCPDSIHRTQKIEKNTRPAKKPDIQGVRPGKTSNSNSYSRRPVLVIVIVIVGKQIFGSYYYFLPILLPGCPIASCHYRHFNLSRASAHFTGDRLVGNCFSHSIRKL
jgi:hypothetical protein